MLKRQQCTVASVLLQNCIWFQQQSDNVEIHDAVTFNALPKQKSRNAVFIVVELSGSRKYLSLFILNCAFVGQAQGRPKVGTLTILLIIFQGNVYLREQFKFHCQRPMNVV